MLIQIKNYLKTHKKANLVTLAKNFSLEIEPLRDMLALLISKGQVGVSTKTEKCGTQCQQCTELVTEIYEWKKI